MQADFSKGADVLLRISGYERMRGKGILRQLQQDSETGILDIEGEFV
jgi:hypothetical protein